jgi:hypothetical protein
MKEFFKSVIKKLKITMTIVSVLVVCVLLFAFLGTKSDGYRGGTLIKLSKKGILFKTLEGQLNVGTFLDNGINKPLSPIWDFSVKEDKTLFDTLNHAILTNKRVKLHYKEKFIQLPWRGETPYIVDDVEIIP